MPALERFIADHAAAIAWHSGMAFGYAMLDEPAAARRHLEVISANDFARLPRDANRVAILCELAEAVGALGDVECAGALYALLTPYAGRNCTNGRAAMCYGATDHFLGRLAQTRGRHEEAIAHYEDAEALNERLEAHSRQPDTQHRHAEALLARGDRGDRERALALLGAAEAGAAATHLVHVPVRVAETREAAATHAPR